MSSILADAVCGEKPLSWRTMLSGLKIPLSGKTVKYAVKQHSLRVSAGALMRSPCPAGFEYFSSKGD
jgi:hypothetical protein